MKQGHHGRRRLVAAGDSPASAAPCGRERECTDGHANRPDPCRTSARTRGRARARPGGNRPHGVHLRIGPGRVPVHCFAVGRPWPGARFGRGNAASARAAADAAGARPGRPVAAPRRGGRNVWRTMTPHDGGMSSLAHSPQAKGSRPRCPCGSANDCRWGPSDRRSKSLRTHLKPSQPTPRRGSNGPERPSAHARRAQRTRSRSR